MFILALVPMLMVLGNAVLIPVLPDIQAKLHISKVAAGLLITMFSVPAGIAIPFAGVLSDRMSRKRIMLVGIALFALGGVVAGVSPLWLRNPYWVILCARIVQGIGAAGTAPIALVLAADLFQGSKRSVALGLNEAGNALGKVISPVIGSLLGMISYALVFFVFPFLAIPVVIVLLRIVPDSAPTADRKSFSDYWAAFRHVFANKGRSLVVGYAMGAVVMFTLFASLFELSNRLDAVKISGFMRGLWVALPLAMLTVTSLWVGRSLKRHKHWRTIFLLTGCAIAAASMATAGWFSADLRIFVAALACYGVGAGLVMPTLNVVITSAVEEAERGLVTGLYSCVRFLGVAAGPPTITWLLGWSTRGAMWLPAVAIACIGIAAAIIFRDRSGGTNRRTLPDHLKETHFTSIRARRRT